MGLPGGSAAGKDEIVDEKVKTDAEVVDSGSFLDESPQSCSNQGPAGKQMEDDEGWREYSRMGGVEMDSQSAIIPEDWFGSSLKIP